MRNTKNQKEAVKKLLDTTAAKEVHLTISKLLLHTDTTKLKDIDKINLEALLLFLKQVE